MNRNLVGAMATIGRCKILRGAVEDGIAALQQAIRLSPRDPFLWSWYFRIGEGHLLQSHLADAIVWLEKARNANPAPPYIHAYLAAAYALSGDTERATAELSGGPPTRWQRIVFDYRSAEGGDALRDPDCSRTL